MKPEHKQHVVAIAERALEHLKHAEEATTEADKKAFAQEAREALEEAVQHLRRRTAH